MNFNTLAPALMEAELHKKIETPFGVVTFMYHNPSKNCLWIRMYKRQGAEVNVDTYITSSNLENYGLMMTVRRKSNSVGPKQKEYKIIEKVMAYLIENNSLFDFDKNKHPR
ncbi:hypothetical protein I6F53_16805 [Pseudoalteromonas sp. SWN29]|uniref:hypothetical protein n=1 Tax=Pseudoalteromonas sp. SWN29 TaxID=2792064 RepID=UPI0018CFAF43|nr:hypothetical protein [Pseudoalteromonas sp. SWN29]MBH0028633.1 hypothetical protein [Pseudoalteromonas sp. SWN29]